MAAGVVEIRFEPVLEVAQPGDGTRDYFGQVTDLAVDAAGTLFVLDGVAARVTVFDRTGAPLASFGTEGEGPAEFQEATRVVLSGAGEVRVADAGTRLVRFRPDGTPLGTTPLPDGSLVMDLDATAEGEIFAEFFPGGLEALVSAKTEKRRAYGWVDLEHGEVRELLPDPSPRDPEPGTPVMFAPRPIWAVGRDGRIVVTTSDTAAIDVRAPDGTVRATLALEGQPRPVTEGDREAILALLLRDLEGVGFPEKEAAKIFAGVEIGEVHPRLTAVRFGPHGTVWLRRAADPHEVSDAVVVDKTFGPVGRRWSVFAPDGRPVAEVEVPTGFEPVTYLGDTVYGVHTDELGVETVRAYRVEGLGGV